MQRMKEIKDFPGYSIRDDGQVLSSLKGKRWLKQNFCDGIYKHVKLSKNGKQYTKRIHRLVAETFLIHDHTRQQVNHKDGNKTNNNISNLEWATSNENMKHAHDNGLMKNVKNTVKAMNLARVSISIETAQAIKNEFDKNGTGQIRLAKMFNTNKSTAYRAARNQIKIYNLK